MAIENGTTGKVYLEIDPVILSGIGQLNLSGSLQLQEKCIIGWGSYGDIFKCHCVVAGRGEIDVVSKML